MKDTFSSPWTVWFQAELPSTFDKKQTMLNCEYLIGILGVDWLEKRVCRKANHPIVKQWLTNGAGAHIILNALAEDIRLLENKPDFRTVLDDLKSNATCLSTWHVIRSAALFERGKNGSVGRFYPLTSKSIPDFSLLVEGEGIPVECKLLTTSECEDKFHDYSIQTLEKIKPLFDENHIYPEVSLVIKSYDEFPDDFTVLKSLKEALKNYKGLSMKVSTDQFNIFIEPSHARHEEYFAHKCIRILCPRSDKESIRVESRVKSASKQLKSFSPGKSGFVCLGIGKHQDPHFIKDSLFRRFENKQLKSIEGCFLLASGDTVVDHTLTWFDLISLVPNKNSTKAINSKDLMIRSVGAFGPLINPDILVEDGFSAYNNSIVEAKAKVPSYDIPFIRVNRIPKAWLK